MATPSFSKRLSIWWAATRLLLGGKQDHISLQHSISQPAIDFRDVQRFGHLRPADRSDCDPRLWGVALRGPDPSDTPKLATRLGLILSVWDSLDQKARNEAFISFRRRHVLLPDDPVLQAVDVFLSTEMRESESGQIDELLPSQKLRLGYWACAINDQDLFDDLTRHIPLADWEKVRPGDVPCPWLGWCTLMDRAQWLEKALDGGMDINAPQSLSDSWKERAKRMLSTLSERVGTLENHLGAEKTKDILSPLSHFVTLGQQFNPLRWAVDIDAEACLDRLLYHGVDAYEQSKIHESALDRAITNHEWGIASRLARHGVPMVFGKNERCASLKALAAIDYSKIRDKETFSQACGNVVRIAAREQSTFNPHNSAWGNVIIDCAGNPKVCPELVNALMEMPDSDQWGVWQRVVTQKTGDQAQAKVIKKSTFELAIVNNNETFMKAVAGKGMSLQDEFKGCVALAWVAWFTPHALEDWLDHADPKHVENALTSELSGVSLGGRQLWDDDSTLPELFLSCPRPEVVLGIMTSHPNGKKALKNSIPAEEWARHALDCKRIETIRAVENAFGVPRVDPGTTLPGWEDIIDRPRSEALLDHLLSSGWPVDVDVTNGGPSLVLRAAEMDDFELVERLVAHGADPLRESKKTISLMQWLAKNEGPTFDRLRTAVAAGQSQWLVKQAGVGRTEDSSGYDRRM